MLYRNLLFSFSTRLYPLVGKSALFVGFPLIVLHHISFSAHRVKGMTGSATSG